MPDPELQDRLTVLEARLRVVEDQLAILKLINSWGPAVDTGHSEAAASLWASDGVLESDLSYLVGPPAVAAMVESDGQQALIRDGSAHVPAVPVIVVAGDTAQATGYTCVYRHTSQGYEVWRVSANHWDFRREPTGWRVTRRTTQVIDGGQKAQELLRRALKGLTGPAGQALPKKETLVDD
jgi:hypothetical protein